MSASTKACCEYSRLNLDMVRGQREMSEAIKRQISTDEMATMTIALLRRAVASNAKRDLKLAIQTMRDLVLRLPVRTDLIEQFRALIKE